MDGKENSKRQEETSLDGETFGSKGQESLLLNFLLFPILLPGNISQINICMDALQLWEVCPLSLCHRTTENKGILQEVGGRGTACLSWPLNSSPRLQGLMDKLSLTSHKKWSWSAHRTQVSDRMDI